MNRTIAAGFALASLALVGCSAPVGEPAPTVTVTVPAAAEPAPTVTVTIPAPAETAAVTPSEPMPDPDELVLFEALGEGMATVIYYSSDNMVQNDEALPFSVYVEPSSVGYIGVVNGGTMVGCRLSIGGDIIDEAPPIEGQLYAECTG